MKVVMNVPITKPEGGIIFLRKDFDLPCTPFIGMEIDLQMSDFPKKVKNVTLIFEADDKNPYLYLVMEKSETESAEEQNNRVEEYKEDGWRDRENK